MTGATARQSYDVVIIGGAIMGSSVAWWLTEDRDFDGSILVVERDPSYAKCSTAHTNSCIRQQFSTPLNVRISRFGAEFVTALRDRMGGDDRIPDTPIKSFGYLYLAADEARAEALRAAAAVQRAEGAATQLLTGDEIAREWPFYETGDIVLGSINRVNEGFFDGWTLFEWFRRKARERGAEYVADEVTGFELGSDENVQAVRLRSGVSVGCGAVVNASGPRAALVAGLAGIDLPVEPRKRMSYIFRAERPLPQVLPLTIDPSGVHVREEGGGTYLAGGHALPDGPCDPDDFDLDPTLWEDKIWPAVAARIPSFETVRLEAEWAGHYAWNRLDQNAVVGPHPRVSNFHFINGFSGHGLQQSAAMGRGLAELLVHGAFRTLDLSPLGFGRIDAGRAYTEQAVI